MRISQPREGKGTVARNLTRDEARDRARVLAVESYQVELDLAGGETTFGTVTTVRFSCASPGASTFIDLTASAVTQITLNGSRVPASSFDGYRITLDGLAATNELRIVASCAYSRSAEGLHRFTDPVDGSVYLYTDFQTFQANRVYPCFDQPDLKATFEFTVLARPGWQVVSNAAPDLVAEPAGDGRERWHFPPSAVMSTYITALAAGPYRVIRDEHDGIPLGIYCRGSLAGFLDPDEIFELTRQGFDFYHAAFGVRYPFGKYDQLFAPEYKGGAMENAGLVTIHDGYVFRSRVNNTQREHRAETILHELAHMWFGDLVTMRWWDDLWLNESFATWASTVAMAEATRWTSAWTTFAVSQKALAYRQDQAPTTHPVAADIPDIAAVEVNFDAITYEKGAAVLKQLVAYVGRDHFLDGMRRYFGQHAWGNATLGDLLTALEEASGRDLSTWSKPWLEAAGVNTLRPEFSTDSGGRFASFAVVQSASASQPVLRPHRIAIGLYDQTDDCLVRRHRVETDIAGERTEIRELTGVGQPDLVLINDDDLSYAKVRFDERSLGTLMGSIGAFTDPLAATLCWAAAWDMCRDGEMAARDYVSLVLSDVDSIADVNVLHSVLAQAATAARRFADPGWTPAGLGQLAAVLRALIQRAEPGSDRQLDYAQSFADVACAEDDLGLLAALLAGSAAFDGLVVDTELRWRLLRRLVSRGAADETAIDAELARDATDAGVRHAATCRAAIPTPAAKEAAWAQITGGKLTTASLRATLSGFTENDQDGLLEPYWQRYFDVVADLWRDWTSDMAQQFVKRAYPDWIVTPEALSAADSYIAGPGLPAPLRRLLTEGRDEVARALRCRRHDRQSSR
jgi:aminopeptidase N